MMEHILYKRLVLILLCCSLAACGSDSSEPDQDRDSIADASDNCLAVANTDQLNTDANFENGDLLGDACDDDDDADGVPDAEDAFPLNPAESKDTDQDTIGDNTDNCPSVANPDQANTDNDSAGNSCDAFANDATETQDFDGDGFGDNQDPDDDNDGTMDVDDAFKFDATEQADIDADGIGDNKDLDTTELTGSNVKSVQMSRMLATDRATKVTMLENRSFFGNVYSIGDVNHDGYDDMVVGEYNYNSSGYAFLIFGQQGGWPQDINLTDLSSLTEAGVKYLQFMAQEGDARFVDMGLNFAALGDINGDGIDDFSLSKSTNGEPKDETLEEGFGFEGYEYSGEVLLIFGREVDQWTDTQITIAELKADYAHAYYTTGYGMRFGQSVINAGDMNGDGINDIAIAEEYYDTPENLTLNNRLQVGRIHIIFGSNQLAVGREHIDEVPLITDVADDYTGLTRAIIVGNEVDKRLTKLVSLGDMNNDGLSDLVFQSSSGEGVFVIWGQANGNWSRELKLEDLTVQQGFRFSIPGNASSLRPIAYSAGDLNGDQIPDLVIGAPNHKESTSNEYVGRVNILWGGRGSWPVLLTPDDMTGFYGITIINNQDPTLDFYGGRFGIGVSVIKDTNGDGIGELLIGKAYNYVDSLGEEPTAHNKAGNIFKLPGRLNWEAETNFELEYSQWFQGIDATQRLGEKIISGGDFDGDGHQDMLFLNGSRYGQGFYSPEFYIVYGYNNLYPEPVN